MNNPVLNLQVSPLSNPVQENPNDGGGSSMISSSINIGGNSSFSFFCS